jgi:predicted CoA-binding protein
VAYGNYSDDHIKSILGSVGTIAMVGASANPNRPSSFSMKYLRNKGYKVIPINPGMAGGEILGEPCFGSLAEIPSNFDMVDIFRGAEAAGIITDEAISIKDEKSISVIWMQLTVINEEAAARAEAAGMTVIMDRCPKIEYGRVNQELGWGGFDSGVISAKRPKTRMTT